MNLGKSSNYFFYRGFISIILNSNRFIRQICFNFFYTLLKTNIVLNLALTVGYSASEDQCLKLQF